MDTSSSTDGEAEAGTRQICIDGYVDCQQNGQRSFPRSRCQACMDLCMGGNYTWPVTDDCNYRKMRNLRPLPPKVRW